MTINFIDRQECDQLYDLLLEMDYNPDVDALPRMVDKLNRSDSDYIVGGYVGEELKGWLHAVIMDRVTAGSFVEIVGLAVAEDQKREGMGQALVKSLRTWAASNGIKQIRVRCNTERKEAHAFYEELDFKLNKKQRVYDLLEKEV